MSARREALSNLRLMRLPAAHDAERVHPVNWAVACTKLGENAAGMNPRRIVLRCQKIAPAELLGLSASGKDAASRSTSSAHIRVHLRLGLLACVGA
jgi:hypothetical protein